MKKRWLQGAILCGLAAVLVAGIAYALSGHTPPISMNRPAGRPPRIRPDYDGAVIPPNIAPLNFLVEEPGRRYVAVIRAEEGPEVCVWSRSGRIQIPQRQWRSLLAANRGRRIAFDVYVQPARGAWERFDAFEVAVAREDVDGYLVYRLLDAGFNLFGRMGIYEREMGTFRERAILESNSWGEGCMNCHTFLNGSPDKMVLHLRSGARGYGSGMLLIEHGAMQKIDTKTRSGPGLACYASWHPSGKLLAFSMNKVRQFFHSARAEVRDVLDLESDLVVYMVDSNEFTSTRRIAEPDRLETYPSWSPDGRYLYFCSAPVLWSDRDHVPPEGYDRVRYDLMRIAYDVQSGRWGEMETVLSGKETGLSITLPRVSPDGRFVLFCMSQYGCFTIFQPSADLYMMDLKTGRYERLPINSDRAETWHSWSSNGRWFVFSSKRLNGLVARPYLAYVDEEGQVRKPFLLPQEDPTFYDGFLKTYNLPELVPEPVPVHGEAIERVIRSAPWLKAEVPVSGATPAARAGEGPAPAAEPWQTRE